MLNALEPGTVMPIHRHHDSSETVVIVRGKIPWVFYDENGNETERVVLDADDDSRMLNAIEPETVMPIHRHKSSSETVDMVPGGNVLNVPAMQWHSLRSLESGTVLLECKDGRWEPLGGM